MRRISSITAVAAFTVASFVASASESAEEIISIFPKDAGTFLIVNAQTRVGDAELRRVTSSILMGVNLKLDIVKGGKRPAFDAVPAELSKLNARGAIWIVDDPALPVSLAAVEDCWGVLNVHPLLSGTTEEKGRRRFLCAALRLFASLFDVGDSVSMPACVMRPSSGVVGLDSLECAEYSPEAFMKIQAGLDKAGFKAGFTGTYEDACSEGIAPAPTNAVQKAIWDRVHQLPSEPIKILPEKKKMVK